MTSDTALVHVHLYYTDMWESLAACVDNVTRPIDLYVTLNAENPQLESAIRGRYPAATILILPNRGFDVAPFIEVLNRVDLSRYTYLVKLHSKRDMPRGAILKSLSVGGSVWRDEALRFVKTKGAFRQAIDYLERHPRVGALGSWRLILRMDGYDNSRNIPAIEQVLRDNGWQPCPYRFVAGTMLLMRAGLLAPLQNKFGFDDFEQPRRDVFQLAHVMERVFGYLVYRAGFTIEDTSIRLWSRIAMVLAVIRNFLYYRKKTNKGRTLVKICKIPVWWKK